MQRIEPELAEAFRKNPADEEFLQRLNAILGPHEEAEYIDLPEAFPTLHIIGVPRSGTTLLSQLVSAHLDVGYINHLIASFWRAPVYGIHLSKKLLNGVRKTSFSSAFGRTSDLWEPHEFGYFWSHHLRHKDMSAPAPGAESQIDWAFLRRVLVNMCATFRAPVFFKSVLVGWYLEKFVQLMRRAVIVRIRRDPVENAASLLKYRREFLGSVDKWVSLMPLEYEWLRHEPVEDQVMGQVFFVEQAHTNGLAAVPNDRVLELTYEELCADPREVLRRISELLSRHGGTVEYLSLPPTEFAKRSSLSLDKSVDRNLRAAASRFYHASTFTPSATEPEV